ncbi:hypothetical protein BDD43_5035 [Mucilaginibacter gracilis]|uniref:Uncharacterized protein n=1 Tax=Mucilaginibacter gracilis TaxID=423350 RepID=A0A495J8C7_9SPHI|nr:hypothetical protein [Mucilaginibacter gracilis]RKR84782.1 hypothetical protein BDD43_5035 [Mucilaginibacter gracilis]
MNDKLDIELTPFEAVTMLGFLREFNYTENPLLKALGDVVQSFEDELYKKISKTQLEDAFAEIELKKLINQCPDQ